jgi:putative chitinase
MTWKEVLQSNLVALGYQPGPIDGVIGPRTLAALLHQQGCRDPARGGALAGAMAPALEAAGLLDRPARLVESLAEWGHETGGFNLLVERFNYSAEAMMRTWPGRFRSHADCLPFIRRPEALANHVYGGRMGNGPPASGDGWRFRGRGLTHTTGRANYARAAARLSLPLIEQPELLEQPGPAVASAVAFWQANGLTALADSGLSDTITRRINGGTTGLEDRRRRKAALRALMQ